MTTQRFHDETIDQYSYIISEQGEAIVVDPSRRVSPYLEYLEEHKLRAVAIVMTHRPGAFASGWAELRRLTGATIVGAAKYKFHGEGLYTQAGRATMIEFGGGCHIMTQLTPGYTPDSITALAMDAGGETDGIFCGAMLLHQGTAYPLPRPGDKNPLHNERTYAKEMYESIQGIIKGLPPKATVYASFGEDAHFSKMDDATHERFNLTEAQDDSPVFEQKNADQFADWLLEDYPFVPAYVAGCLQGNEEGYPDWSAAMAPFGSLLDEEHRDELAPTQPVVPSKGGSVILTPEDAAAATRAGSPAPAYAPSALPLGEDVWIVDTRPAADFRAGHPRKAVNIQADGPFALWLGSILKPGERFHVVVDDSEMAYPVAQSIAKIGYDREVTGVSRWDSGLDQLMEERLDLEDFKEHHIGRYTIVDVRPPNAAIEDTRFYGALNVPVWTLRDRWKEIPQDRPIVVHCGGGYQSAIGASLLRRFLGNKVKVYDLGEQIKEFKGAK